MPVAKGQRIDPWTDEDYALMEAHPDWPAARLGEAMGKTPQAIYKKRSALKYGFEPLRRNWWTADEDAVILAANTHTETATLAEQLPGRSHHAIQTRRVRLGVATVNPNEKRPEMIGARPLIAKTCISCGLLLVADWFNFQAGQRLWQSRCKKCLSVRAADYAERNPGKWRESRARDAAYATRASAVSKRSTARLQAITVPRATANGQEYTDADHSVLRDPDLTILQKALRLHRSYLAIIKISQKHGYYSHVGLGDPETDQWIIDNPNEERLAS